MSDQRKRDLENFVRRIKYKDNPNTSGIISPETSLYKQALEARNIAEEALANEVLKNTGVPIPSKGASLSKKEDFLNRVLSETYPEFDGNPNLSFMDKPDGKNHGYYDSRFGSIKLNSETNQDISKALSTSLHEAGHKYDEQIRGFNPSKELLTGHPSQLDVAGMYEAAKKSDLDPTELYEIAAKGHHARIPDLRDADSFGLGALKSYLKSGKFKSVAGAVPVVGTAAAVGAAFASPDASAAVADAIVPGGVESLGPSDEDAAIENPQTNPELRKAALKKLMGR